MRLSSLLIFFAAWFAGPTSSSDTRPTVSLPYARYQGYHNSTSGLDVFLGIRFAQAPVDELRWRAPISPLPLNHTLQATSQPAKCLQQEILSGNFSIDPDPSSSEDCLFLNIFTPRLSTIKKKLPVLVWIHGGAYLIGDAASYNPTAMIQASNMSFVGVAIQYRLGIFGFLPGSKVKENGALNAGLLDIQFALEWTRKNIHLFGGDPDQVTIWGESAGGGAVLMQAIANGGKTNPPLFKRAIASSPWMPPTYKYDHPEVESQYTHAVRVTRCNNAADTLGCLRSLDYKTLFFANDQLPLPVVDGSLIRQRPQLALMKKQVNVEQLISLHNTDEGSTTIIRDPNSTVRSWMAKQFPNLSEQNLTAVEDTYQVFADKDAPKVDNTFKIQSLIMGESNLICPSIWAAGAFKNGYKALFAVPPAVHGLDVNVYFPDIRQVTCAIPFPGAPVISQSLTESFMGALVSFVLTGTPNKNPMNKVINPYWPTYDPKNPRNMVFNITKSGIADPKFTSIDSALGERCRLWAELSPYTPQ